MTRKTIALCTSLLGLAALLAATPADAIERIRIRSGGKDPNTVTIDETSTPPKITVSAGVAVRGAPGALVDLGGGEYEILVAGNAAYHVKTRGGIDSITVLDGPGDSTYWLGAGADSDTLFIQDGPGADEYKIEGKGGDDVYDILDNAGDGDDYYYVKASKGFDVINIDDGLGDDTYKVKATPDATLNFTDAGGDDDFMKVKPSSIAP